MLLKTAPGGFLCAAIRGTYLSGQRFALLKTAPGGFLCPGKDGIPTLQLRGSQSLSVIRTIRGAYLLGMLMAAIPICGRRRVTKNADALQVQVNKWGQIQRPVAVRKLA